ncbi:FHA domain-containing protein [Neorhodopirellula lusitana]|uniref:FHA domain-containing protein n=1 Tax=Neorhodopirellula lusitana TaxID=445327 RepID=UPI00384AE7B7
MFDRLKRLFVGSDSQPDRDESQTIAGESLDQEIDAVRQTQLIDPSQLQAARDAAGKSGKSRRAGKSNAGASGSESASLYRPSLRPPMGFLAALDDGSIRDAEIYRLRGGSVVIGRQEGDIQFPYEVLMSSKHAKLECRRHRSGYQWHFTDLESRNGSFFRVQRAYLRHDQEFLIGRHRVAFQIPTPGADATTPTTGENDLHATQLIESVKIAMPRLRYRDLRQETEHTHVLDNPHLVIGADSSTCGLTLHDEFVCPNHTRIHHTEKGWLIEDLGSRNGVWLRLHQAKLDQITEFQLGEQRFYFRPPKSTRS